MNYINRVLNATQKIGRYVRDFTRDNFFYISFTSLSVLPLAAGCTSQERIDDPQQQSTTEMSVQKPTLIETPTIEAPEPMVDGYLPKKFIIDTKERKVYLLNKGRPGRYDTKITHIYNANGDIVEEMKECDGYDNIDGTIDSIERFIYVREANGDIVEEMKEWDFSGDGTIERRDRCSYDKNGYPVKETYETDEDNDGIIDTRIFLNNGVRCDEFGNHIPWGNPIKQ